jgi:peptide/nickel transport system ATP-binding protein
MNPEEYLLYVEDLSIEYTLGASRIYAVNHVTFGVRENESIGIVGESGCGKSTLAMAIAHILPPNAKVTSGRVLFKGTVIVDSNMGASYSIRYSAKEKKIEDQLKMIRWKGVSVVFQGALDSLNPVHTVGTQLSDIFIYKEKKTKEEAAARSKELLSAVGLEEWVFEAYPHQLSGGMKQRVIIAMAISLRPALVIADEPTTSLDVITQYRIIEELSKLRKSHGVALLNISHDMPLISRLSDRLMVMYAGIIVEKLPGSNFLIGRHPYTHLLVNSIPRIEEDLTELLPIKGAPPRLRDPIRGCPFFERCDYSTERCREEGAADLVETNTNHQVACIILPSFQTSKPRPTAVSSSNNSNGIDDKPVLEAINLSKVFQKRSGLREISTSESDEIVAVDAVNLNVLGGEIVALVGETGSGKTTLSRMLGILEIPTSGVVKLNGISVEQRQKKKIKQLRRIVQTIFQDPFQSVNPRFSVFDAIVEPLVINKDGATISNLDLSNSSTMNENNAELKGRSLSEALVKKAMSSAELVPYEDFVDKYPHQLSGGQRQRLCIARGLILNPKILIADEPISMLDVSLRAGVLNLLKKLRSERGISILYITHDIASARYLSDRIYVMYKGEIVESGYTEDLIKKSAHPYTIALLLASIGVEGSIYEKLGERIFVQREASTGKGCKFSDRCQFAKELCTQVKPELYELSKGHFARCHFTKEVQEMKLTEYVLRMHHRIEEGT